jgi:hypothetical protein
LNPVATVAARKREGVADMRSKWVGALWVTVFLIVVILSVESCDWKGGARGGAAPDVILGSVEAKGHKVEFYIDYEWDSAVLGFAVHDQPGIPPYFPMWSSTYRAIEPVTLTIFLWDNEEEMWIQSSWRDGTFPLAYYRFGDGVTVTATGTVPAFSVPTPDMFGGGADDIPPMDPARVKKVLTLVHTK